MPPLNIGIDIAITARESGASGGTTPDPAPPPFPRGGLLAANYSLDRVGYREGAGGVLTPEIYGNIKITALFTRESGSPPKQRLFFYAEDATTGNNLPADAFSSLEIVGGGNFHTFLSADADHSGDRWRWTNVPFVFQDGQTYAIQLSR